MTELAQVPMALFQLILGVVGLFAARRLDGRPYTFAITGSVFWIAASLLTIGMVPYGVYDPRALYASLLLFTGFLTATRAAGVLAWAVAGALVLYGHSLGPGQDG